MVLPNKHRLLQRVWRACDGQLDRRVQTSIIMRNSTTHKSKRADQKSQNSTRHAFVPNGPSSSIPLSQSLFIYPHPPASCFAPTCVSRARSTLMLLSTNSKRNIKPKQWTLLFVIVLQRPYYIGDRRIVSHPALTSITC